MAASVHKAALVASLTLLWCASLCRPQQHPDQSAILRLSQNAEEAMAAKNPMAAVAALERLAQLTPNVTEVHAQLGMAYYAMGQYDKATAALKRALQLKPGMPEASVVLGFCYAQRGSFKDALPLLEPAFRQPPNFETGRETGLQLIRSFIALGEYGKAAEVGEEMVRRYPSDPEVLYRVSRLHADRSLQVMLHLVDVAPDSGWKRMAFGQVHEAQKQYDLAIVEYRNALKTDPKLPTLHYRLGHAIVLNAPDNETAREEALGEFKQELVIDPHNPDAEYEIGEIYRQRGQLELSRQYFLRALENDPSFEKAQVALARILVDLRMPKDALPHLLA